MVSLWGSKKDDSAQDQNAEQSAPGTTDSDERTRLLPSNPPPPGHDSYLSPDDPAVSPYNLWSVRFMRYFSVFFLGITFLWWALLLVSIFVSPPGMHSRGSGFFDFSYTTLTLGILLITLLFFSSPSKAAQVSCLVIAIFLLVDTILIVSITRLRVEEGWVGIASVVWALLISFWMVVTDRTVAWGKREEEERLTGRQETRRTLLEWLSVTISTIILILLGLVTLLLTLTLILRARDGSLQPPGERYLVDGEKYAIHLYCEGNSTDAQGKKLPTVLFEAGEDPFEGTLLPLAVGALTNGTISRYCYYDRPGFGWSENAPSPFSAGMDAGVLSEALSFAGESGPYILVSAGVGSIYSRIFSSRQGTSIHGLLLIDPLHEDLLYTLAAPKTGFFLWAWGVISPLGLDRLFGAVFKGRTREDRVYGRASYQGGKYIKAKLQESLVANSLTKNEVGIARNIQRQSTPLVVVSSGIEVGRSADWESKQRDLSHLTHDLRSWDIVSKAPHQVWKTLNGREVIERRLRELVRGN